MKDLAIYGAGGFGRELACTLNIINAESVEPEWNLIGFFDDGKPKGTTNEYGTILGGIKEVNGWTKELSVVIAIGAPTLVRKIAVQITNPCILFPNIFFHTSFADEKNYSIGHGNIFEGGCHLSCNVQLGNFNVFNGSVIIGHDTKVGSFNTFMPAVRVSGEVEIGDGNFFGVGSIVLQQIQIGTNVKLGAGSVMITRPRDGQLYLGNPAKLFRY